jgi:hypothetical protein
MRTLSCSADHEMQPLYICSCHRQLSEHSCNSSRPAAFRVTQQASQLAFAPISRHITFDMPHQLSDLDVSFLKPHKPHSGCLCICMLHAAPCSDGQHSCNRFFTPEHWVGCDADVPHGGLPGWGRLEITAQLWRIQATPDSQCCEVRESRG